MLLLIKLCLWQPVFLKLFFSSSFISTRRARMFDSGSKKRTFQATAVLQSTFLIIKRSIKLSIPILVRYAIITNTLHEWMCHVCQQRPLYWEISFAAVILPISTSTIMRLCFKPQCFPNHSEGKKRIYSFFSFWVDLSVPLGLEYGYANVYSHFLYSHFWQWTEDKCLITSSFHFHVCVSPLCCYLPFHSLS